MINATKETFQSEVLDAKGTVLVDFWASWCGPCKMFAPVLDEVVAERPEVKLVKVDVDKEFELAQSYRVSGIPTLLVFKDGELKETSVGSVSKAKVLSML